MSLFPFFEWCESTGLGLAVRESVWLFPVIESVHLLGLCLLGGSVLVVDMRMLGAGLTRTPVALLARQLRPWLVAGVVVMMATGVLLFLSEAVKCYYSQAFWVKITTLPVALLFTFAVRQRVAVSERSTGPVAALTGAASLALWFTVAAAGRWIGFS
jgi:hypothetical protein